MKAFEYEHIVGFEETNVVGNVYYANYIKWQGRCREIFLQQYVPNILKEIDNGLSLVTMNVSCDFFKELFAFDKVLIKMYLKEYVQNRVTMEFEYWKVADNHFEELIAKGNQQIASMRKTEERLEPEPLPEPFINALSEYKKT
ncbi:enediyne biosynthesis thioesterase [Scopulibacillus darangshiensis]|uniref:Enediyne biosynthesis thioesterase n=1 Tax=Scopulibacillus darangshiensis TaxID=442528 RepID=A0A4R2NSR4_9BACL|nr:acyl-CoA thioesterase [Scopulibacillus darangshiensis]TCP24478.1 enediyne biosynthesis thioesterase [Scopulibacillus darangshiensis]